MGLKFLEPSIQLLLLYTCSNTGRINYQGARFNVIPDPNQATGVILMVGVYGNTYTIELPTLHIQSSLINSNITLSTSETAYTSDGILQQVYFTKSISR